MKIMKNLIILRKNKENYENIIFPQENQQKNNENLRISLEN